ncbi:hypothetical protein ES705_22082 [subsurface metagenome]
MIRFIAFILLLNLLSTDIWAQILIKGVFKMPHNSYETGDTAVFAGAQEDADSKKLYFISESSNDLVPADKVGLLFNEANFWDLQQFYYISSKIKSKGWQIEKRKKLEQKTLTLLAKLESEKKIYEDKFVEDYLQRLVQNIHYPEFSKGRDQFLNVKILNSDNKICYAFDNGTILISTQLITDLDNEKELFRILSEAVAHILLDSNIDNIDANSESDYRQLGAVYPESTKRHVRLIAEKYLSYYEKKMNSDPYSDQVIFINSIASIISYTAWQEYYNQQYNKSLLYINKLVGYGIANSSDYLLNAKIYLKIANTSEANQKALEYLQKATEFEDQLLPEIYSEMGIVQLREEEYLQARESFKKYYEIISSWQDEEKKKWAVKMINTCTIYIQQQEEDFLNSAAYPESDSLMTE